jgi:hypothetical protein
MINKERKVVQIASMTGDSVMILCDDGSLWQLQWTTRTQKWEWSLVSLSGPDAVSKSSSA